MIEQGTFLPVEEETPSPHPIESRAQSSPAPQPVSVGGTLSITPKTSDRVAFLGSTGSGKTTLGLGLLSMVRSVPVVIVDTKGDDLIAHFAKRYGYYESTRLCVPSERYPRVVIRGVPSGSWWDPLFWAVMKLPKGCLVYVDELSHLTNPWKTEPGLQSAYATGRGRRVGVWGSTQRPARIAVAAISEADHVFCFRLGYPEDEDTAARIIRFRDRRFDSNALPEFAFAYKTHRLRNPVVARAITPII